ncbi:glycosyltransferase [Neolewinella antarctica]|uniref:Cellulose synthase/poly-beta-1,6-N-acetylglucosamine synthase-like glycosyltransferase n=1 Tax=Neolewinella antarctica TaxID=442734 RepID=A0ABX0X7B1_9BACT|nr:glycosyltransferase [Neolewinella antarctica]NJC25126.1 cellulose synthase/poly-beta-1,6-N-acetylglucosamine synthase-like glycosyltransferase [Neolewinella antarctica]
MAIFFTILLVLCVAGVAHTYLVYPWYVVKRAGARPWAGNQLVPHAVWMPGNFAGRDATKDWPDVHVLMAAHNEEAVLERKLTTLADQDYPGKLHYYVGSDNSSDRTNQILTDWANRDDRLRPTLFTSRQGKPSIINQLAIQAGTEGVYVLTDASVMLRPSTVRELVRPFLNDAKLALVDTTMVQTGGTARGIGETETQYIDREVAIKRAEGKLWGAMIGPFGGCYALLAGAYRPVPDKFLVDDFYLCLSAYEQGYRGISSATAIVEESVGQHLRDEFRRKVRISSGNWQNLIRFRNLWWPPWRNPLAFAFFSHKVLRWLTPFLLLIGGLAWVGLAVTTLNPYVLKSVAVVTAVMIGGVLLDAVLSQLGIHVRALRKLRYFLAMNLALLVGFYRYLTGISSNVWQPSNRN